MKCVYRILSFFPLQQHVILSGFLITDTYCYIYIQHTKQRREPMSLLEVKLQQAVNENAKVKDKHIEIPELWHRLFQGCQC